MSKKGSLENRRPRLGDAKFVERLLGVRGGLKSRHLEPVTQRSESKRDRRCGDYYYSGFWLGDLIH